MAKKKAKVSEELTENSVEVDEVKSNEEIQKPKKKRTEAQIKAFNAMLERNKTKFEARKKKKEAGEPLSPHGAGHKQMKLKKELSPSPKCPSPKKSTKNYKKCNGEESSSEEEEPVKYVKKQKKKRKPKIVIEESSSDEEIIIRRTRKKKGTKGTEGQTEKPSQEQPKEEPIKKAVVQEKKEEVVEKPKYTHKELLRAFGL
tara:strand:+ start:2008 stop:2610 length:603 start_codon:yes stop_codon:yes gene_type:complete